MSTNSQMVFNNTERLNLWSKVKSQIKCDSASKHFSSSLRELRQFPRTLGASRRGELVAWDSISGELMRI